MARGTVKWFDPSKGFGFVVNEDGVDVFVHYSHIEGNGFRCLRNGQVVVYREKETEKGLFAEQVQVVSDGAGCIASDDESERESFPY